jgi:hypothetical protein
VDAPVLSFSFLHGASPQTQSFNVVNSGAGSLSFQVSTSGTASAGVTISQQSGSATADAPVTLVVTVDPSQLPDDASSARILITTPSGESAVIPVIITVAASQPRLNLPQRGFLFTAVQGGGVTPPQPMAVLNSGDTAFSYSATAIPLSGSGWLNAASAVGSSSPSTFDTTTVSVRPANLSPGVYYGLVRIAADGTANSPQDVEVALNLLTPDFDPGAVVGPTGLVFAATAGNSDPGSQSFRITNLGASAVPFALRPVSIGGAWLVARPDSAAFWRPARRGQ